MKYLRCLVISAILPLLTSCGGGGGDGSGAQSGNGSGVAIGAGQDVSGYSISGRVVDSGPVTKLQLYGPVEKSTQADLDGRYTFTGLQAGTYRLVASDSDGDYSPAEQMLTISGANVIALDFSRVSKGGDGLPEELLAKLDAAPPSEITPEQIVFADGQTLEQYRASLAVPNGKLDGGLTQRQKTATEVRNETIKKMIDLASKLSCKRNKVPCADPQWVYEADKSNPTLRPKQSGLAYVYGSKSYASRAEPLGACKGIYEAYGLDCSGLMHIVAAAGGITIPTGSAGAQSDPNVWLMSGSTSPVMYEVSDGSISIGDIVYFSTTGHIGVVSMAGADPEFIASNGGDSAKRCESNLNKGPTQTKISYFGKPAKVLRLSGSLSGPVTLSGPASIPVCSGTLTVNGTGSIDLLPTPKISLDISENISLTNAQGAACYSLANPLKIEIPLIVSGDSLKFAQTDPFTCAAPCVSGTSSWSGDLSKKFVGGKLVSITGTITHGNSNQTPFNSSATGTVSFAP